MMIESVADFIKALAVIGLCIFGVVSCAQSDWYQTIRKSDREAIARDQTPHIVRSSDGCQVYEFLGDDGHHHYFTRCADSHTSTSTDYSENCGKGCVRQFSETIEMSRTKP